jgi:hypothetical protein
MNHNSIYFKIRNRNGHAFDFEDYVYTRVEWSGKRALKMAILKTSFGRLIIDANEVLGQISGLPQKVKNA